MNFEDEDEAKIWILINQIARRNIEPFRRLQLITERDRLKKLRTDRLKKRLKNLELSARRNGEANDGSSGKEMSNLDTSFIAAHGVSDKDDNNTHQNTREEIAEELGVSTGTVAMMEQIDKKSKEGKVVSKMLEDLRKGRTSVGKVYSDLKKNEIAKKGCGGKGIYLRTVKKPLEFIKRGDCGS
ncbi:MAG: hypothetical protein M0Z77_03895 [Thermoplasmatales archaeon]|jgi:hypothetical protein|nr:hypothetical protein [Thermoplasmatales archaeon]